MPLPGGRLLSQDECRGGHYGTRYITGRPTRTSPESERGCFEPSPFFWAGTVRGTTSRRGPTTRTSFSALEEIRTPNLLIRSSKRVY